MVNKLRNQLTIDNTKLNKIAHQIFLTENPGTTAPTKRIVKPLRIKLKSPKVKMFRGNVNKERIGLTTVLTIAKTTETTMAVKKLATLIPADKR